MVRLVGVFVNGWEVVEYGMDEFYATDVTVAPRVLSRHRSRRAAERAAYREKRGRALRYSESQWRATSIAVRRAGDWDSWGYVSLYGDRAGAE